MKEKEFLFNPKNPKKSFDVYIDKNPKDTIPIKYSSLKEVKETINTLEKLYKNKKYPHKRISQVAMILMVRTRIIKDKNPSINKGRAELSKKYFEFLKTRTKEKDDKKRFKMSFKV